MYESVQSGVGGARDDAVNGNLPPQGIGDGTKQVATIHSKNIFFFTMSDSNHVTRNNWTGNSH